MTVFIVNGSFRVGAGVGEAKHNVYSIYADFASVPTLTTRSRGVPSDTTRSAGAGDVQAKPVAAMIN